MNLEVLRINLFSHSLASLQIYLNHRMNQGKIGSDEREQGNEAK